MLIGLKKKKKMLGYQDFKNVGTIHETNGLFFGVK